MIRAQFRLCESCSHDEFVSLVNAALVEGFEPIGKMQVILLPGREQILYSLVYLQPMLRPELP